MGPLAYSVASPCCELPAPMGKAARGYGQGLPGLASCNLGGSKSDPQDGRAARIEPGTRFGVLKIRIQVSGVSCRQVSYCSWHRFIRTEVFRPVGMTALCSTWQA